MTTLPNALFWRRLDTAGAEHTLLGDSAGLRAKGTMLAATPIPFTCRYEVSTDDSWVTAHCEVTAAGAGFARSVRLERAAGRWRVSASEEGNLDAALLAAGQPRPAQPGADEPSKLDPALDVDLDISPLTNTLPIRRLGLLNAPVGTEHHVLVASIRVPSLEVVDGTQLYTVVGDHRIRFNSGTFTADIDLDEQGYVVRFSELAERA